MSKTSKPKKIKTISLRCTEAEYNALKKAADKNSKKISDYILNQSIAGRAERNMLQAKDRKAMSEKVYLQQVLNDLDTAFIQSQYSSTNGNIVVTADIIRHLNDLKGRVLKLWES